MPDFQHTNALAGETSPYLLQHAHNPVDWMPWGEAAFAKARAQNKPIFLSVGYATCYWCHVMEREVFENGALAQVVNQICVCVKVDREERPDVDALYMAAVHLTGGRGGWPMSVFLTPPGAGGENDPGLKPFWGGTYIPPSAAYGQPGFAQLVEAIGRAWKENKPSVLHSAEQIAGGLREEFTEPQAQVWTAELARACAEKTTVMLGRMYDPAHGGFGEAPKFPQPCWPHFLLNHAPAFKAQVRHTLDQMARGGIFDQIGGGFHRYSVDEKWLVPHFEKMLYDNGQLLALYADFLAAHPSDELAPLCMRVLRQTGDYLLREMTDPSGMFWTAQDAEVDGQEGLNYLWTQAQLNEVLGEADGKQAARLFGVDLGTNFQDPHHPHSAPSNVLFLPQPLAPQDEALREQLALRMKAARNLRKQPTTDDKCLAAWNGLAIAGLARAGAVLGEARFTQAAARAAQSVLKNLASADGGLLRSWRKGQAGPTPGFLEDYACMIQALLALREVDEAARLAAQVEQRFAAPQGGYFDSTTGDPHLLVRVRSLGDGAMPSGSSVMAHNLRLLAQHTGNPAYTERLNRLLAASSIVLSQTNLQAVWLLDAAQSPS